GGDVCTDAIGFGLHCCSDALLVRLVVHGLCRHGCRNGLHVHGRCVLHVHVCSLHVCSLHVVHVHVCRLHVVHVHVCRLQGRCICRCTDEVCMHALRGACSDRRDLHTDLLAVACRLQPRGELGVALGLRDVLRDGAGGAARAGGGQRREPGAVGQALGLACLEEPVQQAVAPLGGLVGAVPPAAEQVDHQFPEPGGQERREQAPPGGRQGGGQRQVPVEVLHDLEQGPERAGHAGQDPGRRAEHGGGLQAVRLDERCGRYDGEGQFDHATEHVGGRGLELHDVLGERDAAEVGGAVGDDGDQDDGGRQGDQEAADEGGLGCARQVCRCGGFDVHGGGSSLCSGRDWFPDLVCATYHMHVGIVQGGVHVACRPGVHVHGLQAVLQLPVQPGGMCIAARTRPVAHRVCNGPRFCRAGVTSRRLRG